jgi:hypothetical protein
MRLATALSVAENPLAPSISLPLASWAIDYVRHYGTTFMETAAYKIADSDHHRLYNEILRVVTAAGARGATERELSQASRAFKRAAPIHRDAALTALARDEAIAKTEFTGFSGRGKHRSAWVAGGIIADKTQTAASTVITRMNPGFQE